MADCASPHFDGQITLLCTSRTDCNAAHVSLGSRVEGGGKGSRTTTPPAAPRAIRRSLPASPGGMPTCPHRHRGPPHTLAHTRARTRRGPSRQTCHICFSCLLRPLRGHTLRYVCRFGACLLFDSTARGRGEGCSARLHQQHHPARRTARGEGRAWDRSGPSRTRSRRTAPRTAPSRPRQ